MCHVIFYIVKKGYFTNFDGNEYTGTGIGYDCKLFIR